MAHLCPVWAYADYIHATQITDGYLFQRMMAAEWFLERFHLNLLDIKIDYFPYGTHSFHHGSCQWMSIDLCWHLHQICEWGGWSTEFTNLTIMKYLISWNDNPLYPDQRDFFKFD
ncbi:hypothetical protein P691DRAFT_797990 [Macrolepiota fuliginosa MF-IS2]|uniref:Uncharacterized protein n=1 Tax=Macrolepiota fuliginosa MF-IS2 TaxID=1400762 RepID=A0A9P6BYT8_9AGAR|nr:hypothetical protein P691DRAFT_797990 [Macrolepiota fuliginosa MF-IS2]